MIYTNRKYVDIRTLKASDSNLSTAVRYCRTRFHNRYIPDRRTIQRIVIFNNIVNNKMFLQNNIFTSVVPRISGVLRKYCLQIYKQNWRCTSHKNSILPVIA